MCSCLKKIYIVFRFKSRLIWLQIRCFPGNINRNCVGSVCVSNFIFTLSFHSCMMIARYEWSIKHFKVTSKMGCDGDIEKWLLLLVFVELIIYSCKCGLKSDFQNSLKKIVKDRTSWCGMKIHPNSTKRICVITKGIFKIQQFFFLLIFLNCQKVWLVQNGERLHLENIVLVRAHWFCVCAGGTAFVGTASILTFYLS